MKALKIPSIFTAVDKFSGPVNKMSKTSGAAFARMERSSRKVSKRFGSLSKKAAVAAVAIALPLGILVNEAIKFEDKMADVAKVANIELGSAAFEKVSEDAKNLGIQLGKSAIESAELIANLAQGGVALKDLNEVALVAGKISVAFGIAGSVAGESFVKTKNALGGTIEDTIRLMDAVNLLGNNYASTSEEVLRFLSSGGSGVARALNASGESAAAFGSELIAVGKSAEESATIMEKFARVVIKNKELKKIFKDSGEGAKGMLAIIEKGSKLSGDAQDKFLGKFGNFSSSIKLLTSNYDSLSKKLGEVSDSTLIAGSVQKEFDNRTKTTAFKLAQMKSEVGALAIDLGNVLLPMVIDLVKAITPVIKRFSQWAKRNKELVSRIAKITVVLAALVGVVSIVTGVVSAVATVISVASAAMGFFNTILLANPIGLVIIAVAALAAGLYLLSRAFGSSTRAQRLNSEVTKRALKNSINQRVEAKLLFNTLRNVKVGSDEYTKTLVKIEELQPGLIKQYNLQAGALDNINRAEKELTKSIIKRAEEQARTELLQETVRERVEIEDSGTSFSDKLKSIFTPFVSAEGFKNERINKLKLDEKDLLSQIAASRKETSNLENKETSSTEKIETLNPEKASVQSFSEFVKQTTNKVIFDFKNVPKGLSIEGDGGENILMPTTGSTSGG